MTEPTVAERVRTVVRRPPLRHLIGGVLREHGVYTSELCRALGRVIAEDEICMTELWSRIDRKSRQVKAENALLQRTLDGVAEELVECQEAADG